ncbi:hypothetical protein M885DRAFT_548200 [Pelagophyceae sp. CCMP2097]|nr:hypothetical protein M885DRAFT_548200 [Pelagophyceae sp. CCMP2097]
MVCWTKTAAPPRSNGAIPCNLIPLKSDLRFPYSLQRTLGSAFDAVPRRRMHAGRRCLIWPEEDGTASADRDHDHAQGHADVVRDQGRVGGAQLVGQVRRLSLIRVPGHIGPWATGQGALAR